MVINLLSIRCSLSFAPYLTDAVAGYLDSGSFNSRVVKQGGNGLIMRSDAKMALRFQAHEAMLGKQEARHYQATLAMRRDHYDIARMADEVIFANVGDSLMLSHPQSEIWLDANAVAALVRMYGNAATVNAEEQGIPDWLTVSTGADRLLLSDQRTGRWVLLGEDHIAELKRRAGLLAQAGETVSRVKPPQFNIKGIAIHLQAAFKLAEVLERFAESGQITPYVEQSPGYELVVEKATEGVALLDFEQRVGLTAREARKYAAILRDELEQHHAVLFERGDVRTVVADEGGSRWVLQWGDEILLSGNALAALREQANLSNADNLVVKRDGEFLLLLAPATGACAALTDNEAGALQR
jgi:hypothetical protein